MQQNIIWTAALFHPFLQVRQDLLAAVEQRSYLQGIFHWLSKINQRYETHKLWIESHPEESDVLENILRLAVRITGVSVTKQQSLRPVRPILGSIFAEKNRNGKEYVYPLRPLELSCIFPQPSQQEEPDGGWLNHFFDEMSLIEQDDQLLYLMEKYFWCVSDSEQFADTPLYDRMKTLAAVAGCLLAQHKQGLLPDVCEDDQASLEQHFMLIHGDVSGIQNFIFSIPSKGGAKSLKGRSVYVGLLSDCITRYFIDGLELNAAHLLYNGGGNFYILAPACLKPRIEQLRKNVAEAVFNAHEGKIYFAIEWLTFSAEQFAHFSTVWQAIKDKTNQLKKRKWSELGLKENYEKIFGPIDEGSDGTNAVGSDKAKEGASEETKVCKVCGSFSGRRPLLTEIIGDDPDEEAERICTLCRSFIDLTNQLRDSRFIIYKKCEKRGVGEFHHYQDVFRTFGYEVTFSPVHKGNSLEQEKCYKLNNTDFLQERCAGYRLGAYRLPFSIQGQITFQELSEKAETDGVGDHKLAFLKLDIDNLGTLFGAGLGNQRTIARVSALSRMLGMFFEGYINELIEKEGLTPYLYVVFSGGDDTFVVGSWRHVFLFAEKLHADFRQFACGNPAVTFSAAINVFHFHYPLVRAAELTEHALDAAKKGEGSVNEAGLPVKNKVSFLGEVFNWHEFLQIKEIEMILENMVSHYGRSVLFRVNKSTLGFDKILKDSVKGRVQTVRFWRLAYYLRNIKQDAVQKKIDVDYAEQLIEKYRDIVVHNLTHAKSEEQIRKIMIIPAAIKWTELATRKVTKEEKADDKAIRQK